ncbi:MAG: PEP-CTERM sorting domain-containing protein [Bryobacteraceae bacterium]
MKSFGLAAAAVVALSGGMFADTVNSATGTFSAFPTGFSASTPVWISNTTPPATTGTPFWNDASDDTGIGPGQGSSHLMNIGYVLTDTGGMTGAPSVLGTDTVTEDFTDTAGGAPENGDPAAFNFVRNATAYNVSLLFADSGVDTSANPADAVGSQIGYYVGSTLTALYDFGPTFSPTGTKPFNPGASGTSYGFYDTVCYAASGGVCTKSETYETGGDNFGNDPGGAAWNHFALFQLASGSYVLGFTAQDGMFGEGLGDFQDTVIELQVITPEPATIAFMGLGLAGLGILGRRRFVKR